MSVYDPLATDTAPVYDGALVPSYPFANDGDPAHVVVSQEYYVDAEIYEPADLTDTITWNAETLTCVGDYDISRDGAGGLRFTRKWANLPADRIEPAGTATSTIPYIEVFATGTGQTTRLFRPVGVLMLYEYFLVATGETYETPDEVPILIPNSSVSINATTGEITTTAATGPGAAGTYAYLLEPSSIERYLGNYWVRTAKYFEGA